MSSANVVMLTPEDVAKVPQPGLIQPCNISFSPDDKLITFLLSPDRSRTLQLYAFDPQTGERGLFLEPPGDGATDENVSLAEALRRERLRQWGAGVTDYAWAKGGGRLLIPLPDGVYVQDARGLRKVIEAGAQDARFSPDGEMIAFVRDGDLWVVDVAGDHASEEGRPSTPPLPDGSRSAQDAPLPDRGRSAQDAPLPDRGRSAQDAPLPDGSRSAQDAPLPKPRALTTGAQDAGVTRGLAEYVAAEEMDRREGFWWSPDGTRIAFAEVDERRIPLYRISHQGKAALTEEAHRYPFAGAENATVRLGVVEVATGETRYMALVAGGPGAAYEYLARVAWLPTGEVVAQVEDRAQRRLDVIRFDPATGAGRPLLHEQTRAWINLHDMFHPLAADNPVEPGGFIWASEGTGFRHLWLHDKNGRPSRALTEGEWLVESLAGVDEARGIAYFVGSADGPTERHLYRVGLGGGKPVRITKAAGWHTVTLDHGTGGARRFVDTHETLGQPPRVTLRSLDDDAELAVIHAADADPRVAALGLTPPELVTLGNRQDDTLYGLLYRPDAARYGPGPYPTLVDVYGGPHVQRATQQWKGTANMRAQYLRSLGFLVFTLDNRGSAGRGLAFEAALKGDMGRVEVEDQADGVRWLVAQGLADRARVGVYGWSYGGYMALMCLAAAPETFAAAVAGAPVTDWGGYDTHYTERYMGLPAENAAGYRQSSPLTRVGGITGKLLLTHGLVDESVHFRHTSRLLNALIAARKGYELLLFPDERHMPRREADRVYMEERIRDFFGAMARGAG